VAGLRVNLGCGATPTPGFVNFDNSLTVRLAAYPLIATALARAGVIGPEQLSFARVAREAGIRWADAARRIPLADASAELVYSSHMLEHLDRAAARALLAEVRRVLAPGGIVRLALPDLKLLAESYRADGDADRFVARTLLATERARGPRAILRALIVGPRDHAWMYDGASMIKLLGEAGFERATELPAGSTTIVDPGALDLRERADESVYVEARR
jgi:SAM-dependent methyltransferase